MVLEVVCGHLGVAASAFTRPVGERPDFATADCAEGMELAEYQADAHVTVAGANKRRRASEVDKLVEDAWAWATATAPEVRLNVYVIPFHHGSGRPDRRVLAAQLGGLALHMAENGSTECRQEDLPTELQPFITLIMVHPKRPESPRAEVWHATEAAWMDASIEAVEHVLAAKEPNVEAYRRTARLVWLVIHASAIPLIGAHQPNLASSCGRATPELLAHVFETAFDRVLYVDLNGPKVHDLRTRLKWTPFFGPAAKVV